MFYDVDILNRRGGKFGVIWLAANGKLRLKGKGSKNDLRLVLEVRVDRICHEIMRYIKIENPPSFPEESRPNPSFSLFLAAKLAHGAIVVHHKQVAHILAHVLLDLEQRAAKKKLKAANISCDVLDLSDAVIGGGSNLLHEKCTLEEREFGRLAEVVDALRISSFQYSPQTTRQVLPREQPLNYIATPADIAASFIEMEITDIPDYNNANIYASPKDVTIKELEPIKTLIDLPPIEEYFSKEGTSAFWNTENLPPLADVDEISKPGPPSLQRSNSKRVHCDDTFEDVPSKQIRAEIVGDAGSTTTEELPVPDMILEPVPNLPAVPRRGGRRRLPRLLDDEEMVIPAERFRAQQDNYEDLLRNKNEDLVITEYAESTVNHIFLRPLVERYQSPLIKELFTRNMKTLLVDNSDFNIVEDTKNARNKLQATPTIESNAVAAPFMMEFNTVAATICSLPPNTAEKSNNLISNRATVEVPVVAANERSNIIVEAIGESLEKLRNPNSREASIIVSANTSNVNVSNFSITVSPLRRPADKMHTIIENSESNASAQRFTNDIVGHPGSLIENSAVISAFPPIGHEYVGAFVPVEDQPSKLSVPADFNVSELPGDEQVSIPNVSTSSQWEGSYPQVIVPESQVLLSMIEEMMGELSSLTFRQLVPPAKYSKLEAAKIFENLLGLTKDRRINMSQCNKTPYGDIFITLYR